MKNLPDPCRIKELSSLATPQLTFDRQAIDMVVSSYNGMRTVRAVYGRLARLPTHER